MAVFVVLAGALGAWHPELLTWVGGYVSWMLGIVMFGMGMTLSVDDFRAVLRQPRYVAIGVVAQFLIMPLVAFGLVQAFGLPPELAIGVILVGTCPGGTASNVISYLARGDVALSVSMTMMTTLLAPIVTPALTLFYADARIEVSAAAMMLSIAKMVLAPVLLGLAAHHLLGHDAGLHQEDLVGQVGRCLGDAEFPEGFLRSVVAQRLDQDGRRPFIDGDLVEHIERSGDQGHGQGEGEPVPVPQADAQDALQENGRGCGHLSAGRRGGGVSHSFHITCFG